MKLFRIYDGAQVEKAMLNKVRNVTVSYNSLEEVFRWFLDNYDSEVGCGIATVFIYIDKDTELFFLIQTSVSSLLIDGGFPNYLGKYPEYEYLIEEFNLLKQKYLDV